MKQWYTRITLYAILCLVGVLAMLYFLIAERNSPGEVRYAMVVLLLPILLAMVVVDIILRNSVKKLTWIWLIEAILILGLVYFWILQE